MGDNNSEDTPITIMRFDLQAAEKILLNPTGYFSKREWFTKTNISRIDLARTPPLTRNNEKKTFQHLISTSVSIAGSAKFQGGTVEITTPYTHEIAIAETMTTGKILLYLLWLHEVNRLGHEKKTLAGEISNLQSEIEKFSEKPGENKLVIKSLKDTLRQTTRRHKFWQEALDKLSAVRYVIHKQNVNVKSRLVITLIADEVKRMRRVTRTLGNPVRIVGYGKD